jgi:hypothetical protein
MKYYYYVLNMIHFLYVGVQSNAIIGTKDVSVRKVNVIKDIVHVLQKVVNVTLMSV